MKPISLTKKLLYITLCAISANTAIANPDIYSYVFRKKYVPVHIGNSVNNTIKEQNPKIENEIKQNIALALKKSDWNSYQYPISYIYWVPILYNTKPLPTYIPVRNGYQAITLPNTNILNLKEVEPVINLLESAAETSLLKLSIDREFIRRDNETEYAWERRNLKSRVTREVINRYKPRFRKNTNPRYGKISVWDESYKTNRRYNYDDDISWDSRTRADKEIEYKGENFIDYILHFYIRTYNRIGKIKKEALEKEFEFTNGLQQVQLPGSGFAITRRRRGLSRRFSGNARESSHLYGIELKHKITGKTFYAVETNGLNWGNTHSLYSAGSVSPYYGQKHLPLRNFIGVSDEDFRNSNKYAVYFFGDANRPTPKGVERANLLRFATKNMILITNEGLDNMNRRVLKGTITLPKLILNTKDLQNIKIDADFNNKGSHGTQ